MLTSAVSASVDWNAVFLNSINGMAEGLFIVAKSVPAWLWVLIAISLVCGKKVRRR